MSLQEQKNLEYCQKTLAFKDRLEKDFLSLGKHLYHIREARLWEGQWSSFYEFSLELKMAQSSISKLVNIYRKFVVDYGIEPEEIVKAGGWTVLAETLRHVTSKKAARHVIHLSSTLSRADLKKELHEARTGLQMAECKHAEVYKIAICRACGDRWQVHEEK